MKYDDFKNQVKVTRDVIFGEAVIDYHGIPKKRPLLLDVYEPEAKNRNGTCSPAIITIFGGAFHFGNKEDDSFTAGETFNTSASAYASYWATRGFVTFSVGYRLTSEDPAPGSTPALASHDSIAPDRMHRAREVLGLPPASLHELACGIEAAADDVAMATRFVQDNADRWNVDPTRVALFGWSAGGRSALNAVFAEGVDVKAVVAASAFLHSDDLRANVPFIRQSPSLMVVTAERDLPHIVEQGSIVPDYLRKRLPIVEFVSVPEVDHFYPASSVVYQDKKQSTLLEVITQFFERNI